MSKKSEYFEVRDTKDGKGLFAIKPIPARTKLIKIWGKIISFEQTLQLGDEESFCLQNGPKSYIATHYPFFLCNHSCEPNCGIIDLNITSLSDIHPDEELRWDYSTSMLERHWTMPCDCGATHCRKKITDFDLLPKALQGRYLDWGIVMPYIVKSLNL